jgi:hypothetical protein
MWGQQAIVGDLGITEVAKGSTFHNLYLWMAGAHIGRDVYFDNGGCMVSCCLFRQIVCVLTSSWLAFIVTNTPIGSLFFVAGVAGL